MKKHPSVFVLSVITLALCSFPIFAQTPNGAVNGHCRDAQGNPMVDAIVVWANSKTGQKYRLRTNQEGRYFSLGISQGIYDVKVYKNIGDANANKDVFHFDGYQVSEDEFTLDFGNASAQGSKIPSSLLPGTQSNAVPLSLASVEHGLKAGVSSTRMATLVKEYGVDFEVTGAVETELREDGATGDLLLEVSRHHVSPRLSNSSLASNSGFASIQGTSSVLQSGNEAQQGSVDGSRVVDAHDCVKQGITPYQIENGYVPANPYPVVALQNTCSKAVDVYFCWLVDNLPGNEWACGGADIEAGKSTGWMQMATIRLACVDGRPPDERPDPRCSHFTVVWNAVYLDSNQKASRPNVPKRTTPQSAH